MVGKNIKKHRENKKMTQDDLAAKLDVTRQAISNWETEKTQPDIETLQKIAQILEVSIEEIIYGTKRETTTIINNNTVKNVKKGLSFGAALAMVISYFKWQSIGWAVLHGLLNWIYVVYYVIRYGWS
ncbi:MAG: helix-turn-helix transcriptional regulator [Clostridia bacterium]